MIAPLALIGLLILPLIVAFYMLRLRRRDVPVGSTFLWQQLVRDVEANAPWQRLRFSWLLLLQLLIAALVVFAATRPFLNTTSDLAANVVLIVDTSASMGATDDGQPRIEAARRLAHQVVARLPEGGRVTVVAADDSAHVLASETNDRSSADRAIDGIDATQLPGNLTDAFALASALAARDADSTVVVVTDANADRLPPVGIGAPVKVERVGSTDANQAVAALSATRRSGGAQLDVFVAVANPSAGDVTRRLEIYADDALVDARDLQIAAGQRAEAIIATVPPAATVIEARLAGSDALAVDDRAFALAPPQAAVRTLLVSDGNTYLENALALLPRLELYAVSTDGYSDAVAKADADGTPYGLLVFDRFVPPSPPNVPALYVGPHDDGAFGTVSGTVDAPLLDRTDPDDPLLRYVDLSTLHVGRAARLVLTDGMRPAVAATTGDPLVAAGTVDGTAVALLTFALGDSDLPLQVAFPLLTSNLVDFLLPPVDGVLPPSQPLGEAIPLAVDPSITAVSLTDGAGTTRIPLIAGRGTLPAAETVGLRELRTEDGTSLGRTAANLFDPGESAVAPGDPVPIEEMGRPATGAAVEQPARVEWWWRLAVIALALLLVEWLLFHRPGRRALARVLRRPRPGTSVRQPRSSS
ncbi:MAG TPA: VWA domain-containing protein [Candidatus Limnocylindria bacterium]|nr:VWA domain-containing protein [Candidatus Limnocylindria bacterium]